jgi:hypothetical protein
MTRLSSFRRMPAPTSIALVLGGLALAGCASGIQTTSVSNPDGSISANKVTNSDIDCPGMMVKPGTSTWQLPSGTTSTNLRYQGSLGQLARECAVLGDSMTIKVGVEGRVLVGPKGNAGNLAVPLRIALVQEGPQPKSVWTKFYPVPVNVPPGQTQVTFTQVEDDLTFAIPPSKDLSSYVIYVGYDAQTGAASAKTAKKKSGPSEPKAASKSKSKPQPPMAGTPQPMTPASTQPTFAPAPPPGQFAPPPQPAGGTNG